MEGDNITQETVSALRSGEHDAFEKVFLTYFNKVKYFITGFVKSPSDAEELAQDVFVKLWINRDGIDPARNFNTYIYISARNATLNFLRSKLVRDSFAHDALHSMTEVSEEQNPMAAMELNLLVDLALQKMPAQRRRVYELSRHEGLDKEEISLRLNISPKTVENQLSLALKELRNVIRSFVVLFF